MARSPHIISKTRDRVTLMSHRIVMLVGLGAWLFSCGAISSVQATERIIVPFTCNAEHGDVYARPSQPQSYDIIGEREAAPFTACASDDADRCRTMMLHRFDIDCDGRRIGWPEFYTAISDATTGRAFIEDNRLIIRVRPQRTRRTARSRFQPPPSRRTFLVEMPDGFAPVRGAVTRFTGERSARTAPLRATRDPFSSTPPRPVAPLKRTARAQPKADIVKPKKMPAKKTAQRNIIVVPKDEKPSKAPRDIPTITKPTARAAPKPAPSVKTTGAKQKSRAVAVPKTGTKPNVVKAPPAERIQKAVVKTKDKPQAPTIIPKLLNGPKETPADKTQSRQGPSGQEKAQEAKKPRSIADLLQDRGAKLRADAKTMPTQKPASTKPDPKTNALREPAPSPTLANTLAVLGIVAGLLLAFSYAAYRFLTPKPSPQLLPPPPSRPAKPRTTNRQLAVAKEPILAGTAQTIVTKAEEKDALKPATVQHLTIKTNTKPASETNSPPPTLAIPKQPAPTLPAPTLDVPENCASSFVTPQLAISAGAKKTEPTLSLDKTSPSPEPAKPQPELPMPKLIAAKIKQPDFDESALLIPKTRQEALTALGVGESAGEDVIERVVAGLRQCWQPDEANDKAERKRRMQRMQQIETAWRILSQPQTATDQHAKHFPN